MQTHKTVSGDEWLNARRALLAKEKAHLRAHDELARQRRELPWVKVDKRYVFVGPNGKETLSAAFHKRMGWPFKWVSSAGSDFNFDYNVSFTEGAEGQGQGVLQFRGTGLGERRAARLQRLHQG